MNDLGLNPPDIENVLPLIPYAYYIFIATGLYVILYLALVTKGSAIIGDFLASGDSLSLEELQSIREKLIKEKVFLDKFPYSPALELTKLYIELIEMRIKGREFDLLELESSEGNESGCY